MWCWCWRASGFAWCVRSQVVGIATRRGARDETGARPAHARPATYFCRLCFLVARFSIGRRALSAFVSKVNVPVSLDPLNTGIHF